MNKDLQKELEEISPMLANLPKAEFEAPSEYFDTFSSRMLERVKEEAKKPSKTIVRPIHNLTKYFAAATVLVFMGMSIYIFKIKNEASVNTNIQPTLTAEDIYLSEIDEATLIEYSNTSSTIELKSDVNIYEEYVDEETIIEEL